MISQKRQRTRKVSHKTRGSHWHVPCHDHWHVLICLHVAGLCTVGTNYSEWAQKNLFWWGTNFRVAQIKCDCPMLKHLQPDQNSKPFLRASHEIKVTSEKSADQECAAAIWSLTDDMKSTKFWPYMKMNHDSSIKEMSNESISWSARVHKNGWLE